MGAMKVTCGLIAAAAITVVGTVSATPAGATPGHTSCKGLGALVASEAQAGTVGEENRSLPHGSVDDLIHAVQVGGEFFGEPIPAFCQPK
jgi:hypothetical protein